MRFTFIKLILVYPIKFYIASISRIVHVNPIVLEATSSFCPYNLTSNNILV